MEQRNSRKRLNSLVLLVAFTAVMLIVSTYAWFSTQKNVTLGGIKGTVNVAEGLQISLDAKTWKNDINFSDFTSGSVTVETGKDADGDPVTETITGLVSPTYLPDGTLEKPYIATPAASNGASHTYATNIMPDELLPVSTSGTESIKGFNSQTGDTTIFMYRGDVYNYTGNYTGARASDALKNVSKITEGDENSKFIAIDFFLQNSSKSTVVQDVLRLEPNSSMKLQQTTKETTGLQNTVRVALALYENTNDSKVTVNDTPSQAQIIQGTSGQKIKDVAIWEPNANAHVQYIVDSNNKILWSSTEAVAIYGTGADANTKFETTTQIPTYVLTSTSTSSKIQLTGKDTTSNTEDDTYQNNSIEDIYNWSGSDTQSGLVKQKVLQTTTSGIATATPLVSAKDGTTEFTIAPGQYHKCRMYIWLEGQDVDCINYASLGGGILVDFGFSKPGSNS